MSEVVCPKCGKKWSIDSSSLVDVRCSACGTSPTAPPGLKVGSELPAYDATVRRDTPIAHTKGRETTMRERAPGAWKVGDTILDLYDVLAVLGRGGMGEVLKVRHRGWGIDLAVKTPRPELVEDPDGIDAFVKEAETWADIGVHPHIVSCYYVRVLGGIPRIFSEYVEGGSLVEWIRGKRLYEGDNVVGRILDIAIQFAWGLHRAHEVGIIHQDVKPANVLMTPDGMAKVADFGLSKAGARLARTVGPEDATTLVSVGGLTPAYASPEQWDRRPLSRRSDLWSWAVSVLEMFCGGTRWTEGPLAPQALGGEFVVPMPATLAAFLGRCFDPDPQKRPATLAEAAEAIKPPGYPRREPRAGRALADGLSNRALSMLDLGRGADADKFLDQALAADPLHLPSTFNRTLLRWREGRLTDEAVLLKLREVQASQPNQGDIDAAIAVIHVERGDAASALAAFDEADRKGTKASRDLIEEGPKAKRESCFAPLRGATQDKIPGHRGAVTSVAFLPDGRILTGGRDRMVRCGPLPFEGATDAVLAVASNGIHVIAGCADKTARVWDLKSGICLHTLAHPAAVSGVAIDSEGRVLTACWDGALRRWHAKTGKCTDTWREHHEGVNAVAASPEGMLAVTGGVDGTVRVWNLELGKCIATLEGHRGGVLSVALAPDGLMAASGGTDQIVFVWDLSRRTGIARCVGHSDRVTGVGIAGGRVVSASRDRTVRIWEAANGRCRRTLEGHTDAVHAVAFDGTRAVSAGETVREWDVPASSVRVPLMIVRPRRSEELTAEEEKVAAALDKARTAVSRKNWRHAVTVLAQARTVGGYERAPETLDLWAEVAKSTGRGTLRDAWIRSTLPWLGGTIEAVAISDDGAVVAAAGGDKAVRLWDRGRLQPPLDHPANATDVQTDGRLVITACLDSAVRVFEPGGKLVQTLRGHKGEVTRVAISWDAAILASAATDKVVRIWEKGACVREIAAAASAMSLSRDGRRVIVGGADGSVRSWAPDELRFAEAHQGAVRAIASGQNHAVTGGEDGGVRLWNLRTGRLLSRSIDAGVAVTGIDVTADGAIAFSSHADGGVRVWNLADGRLIRAMEGPAGGAADIAVAHDLRMAVSGGRDRTLRLWHLDWNLVPADPAHWHEGARPVVEEALACGMPFEELMRRLQWSGYGWLRPEGVKLKVAEIRGTRA